MGADFGPAGQVLEFPTPAPESGAEAAVERINQYHLYALGQGLQQLRFTCPIDVHDLYPALYRARLSLKRLLNGDPLPLGISAGKAKALLDQLDGYWNYYFYERDAQGEPVLNESGKPKFKFPERGAYTIDTWEWASVLEALDKFETVFGEEMGESSSYIVPQRGITSVAALIENGEKAFPDELHHVIGRKGVADFKGACRCFAFDLYTASGYHSARAVEAVLETYYQTFLNKPGETLNGWADYVDALKKVATKKPKPKFFPDPRTLLSIDEIRFHHRNPLMHPRATLTETDADVLLSIAKVAMIGMAQEIKGVWEKKKVVETKIKAKRL